MTFRNPLDTFAPDLTSIQMTPEQRFDLLAALGKEGGEPAVVAAFVNDDKDGTTVIPLGKNEIEEDDMWQGNVVVQVTYTIDSTDQDDLRSILIGFHQDLVENGTQRALDAREAERARAREMVRHAEQNIRDAQAEYERLLAYAEKVERNKQA